MCQGVISLPMFLALWALSIQGHVSFFWKISSHYFSYLSSFSSGTIIYIHVVTSVPTSFLFIFLTIFNFLIFSGTDFLLEPPGSFMLTVQFITGFSISAVIFLYDYFQLVLYHNYLFWFQGCLSCFFTSVFANLLSYRWLCFFCAHESSLS